MYTYTTLKGVIIMEDFSAVDMEYSVSVKTLVEEFKLEVLYMPEDK